MQVRVVVGTRWTACLKLPKAAHEESVEIDVVTIQKYRKQIQLTK